jgi:hypothetical protein
MEDLYKAGLEVIKTTDPALYATITATPWHTEIVSTPDQVVGPLLYATDGDIESAIGAAIMMDGWMGVTVNSMGFTLFNGPAIERVSAKLRVPVAHMTADVIAHEYIHVKGGGEPPAYAESIRFARVLGSRPITEYFEDLVKQFNNGRNPDLLA